MARNYYSTPSVITEYERSAERVRASRERRAKQAENVKNTRKKRDVVLLVIFIAAIALCAVMAYVMSENARFDHAYDLPRAEVVVHSGDTIESIADANPVNGLTTHELAYVIGDINSDSHSNPLMPGDRLNIPVESDK